MALMLKEMAYSLNPTSYANLRDNPLKFTTKYFFFLLLFSVILLAAVNSYQVFTFPDYVEAQFASFDNLTISVDVAQHQPVLLSEQNPLIYIDTTKNATLPNDSRFTISENSINLNTFFKSYSLDLTQYKNILSHKQGAAELLTGLIIFLLPSILVVLYLIFMIKSILLILVGFLIALIINSIKKKNSSTKRAFNCAVLALTPCLLVKIIVGSFFPLFGIHILIYFAYLTYGVYAGNPKKGWVHL